MLDAKQMQELLTESIRKALRGSRFEGISVTSEDDDEDISRPAIKLTTDTTYSREMLVMKAETTAEIFFYAENADEYAIDCMEVQELLGNRIVKGIETGNDILHPENVDCTSSGGVLAISFTLDQMETISDETENNMETLQLGIK